MDPLLSDHNSTQPAAKAPFTLTEDALQAALDLSSQTRRYKNLALRLYIEGKGCDGFYYGVTFDNKEVDDLGFSYGGLECIIDPQTLEFCQDAVIEWIDDERGTGFLVNNPNQWKFRGKFFKRKVWKDKFEPVQSAVDSEAGPLSR